jgi:Family of unknown function (DUF6220)
MQISRAIFAALAWIFVGLIVLQVFWAGMGLFGAMGMSLHRDFGYLISMVPLLITIAAAVGRTGRLIGYAAGLLFLAFVQTSLPLARDAIPAVAALHPVNALLLFVLSIDLARRATALARATRDEATEEEQPATT